MLLNITVQLEGNFEQAEEQKVEKHEDLIEKCEEQEWEMELAVAVSEKKSVFNLNGRRFGYSKKETKKKADRVSLFIWLKWDDNT